MKTPKPMTVDRRKMGTRLVIKGAENLDQGTESLIRRIVEVSDPNSPKSQRWLEPPKKGDVIVDRHEGQLWIVVKYYPNDHYVAARRTHRTDMRPNHLCPTLFKP